MSAPVYVALLHYPMTNRMNETVTTAVTNMDLHDISRTCRTYEVRRYFVLTPLEPQHVVVGRILKHWSSEQSATYHPDRFSALSRIQMVRTFDEIRAQILSDTGEQPEVVLTDAREVDKISRLRVSYEDYARELAGRDRTKPCLIVFGTGWGISEAFYSEVNRVLPPVYGPLGPEGYNHLSVRSAVAIILDRLFQYRVSPL